MSKIRVMIVDDHALFREGLRLVLERERDMSVIGEADTGEGAIEQAAGLRPDVILMDLNLPRCGGLDAMKQIMADRPDSCIIALTMFSDAESVGKVIRAGGRGYVLKESGSTELINAIRAAASGGVALSPGAAAFFLSLYRQRPEAPEASPASQLTARDLDLLELLATGQSNQEIADQLCLSRHTVNNLLTAIYQNLGVSNRTEAVAFALSRGLIPLSPS
jgi:two-component system response regulator DegU